MTIVESSLDGAPVPDEAVARHDLAGGVAAENLGVLPAEAAIVAHHQLPLGDHLVAFETTVTQGAVIATPRDVVRIVNGVPSLEVEGSLLGLSAGVGIDALTMDGTDLLLSFDVTITLGGVTFADEDLARWNGSGWSMLLDASTVGADPALDLDAAHLLDNGHLLLSFDASTTLGGVAGADEDVVELALPGSWSLAYDGSEQFAELATGGLDAFFALALDQQGIFSDGFESGDTSRWNGGSSPP